jgi:fibronectin-binding autotransporter adhesin
MFLLAATGGLTIQLILASTVFGQTWNVTTGDWSTAANWVPATVPSSPGATATFDATAGSSPNVSLTGGPFTVGTLDLNDDVNGGFTFQEGALQLAGSATLNVQSHNVAADFGTTATIALQANSTINTVFDDSTLTVAGAITDSGGFSLTKTGAGTLTLTGSSVSLGNILINGGMLTIQNGAAVSDANVFIANNSGSSGSVTVTGAGSTWASTAKLAVGASGTGTPIIENGAAMSDSDEVHIGEAASSSGTVTVTGAGSTWKIQNTLFGRLDRVQL